MPLTEETSAVARLLQNGSYGDLFRTQCVTPLEGPGAVRVAAGQYTGTSRRADGRGGIKAVQPEAVLRHGIDVGRDHIRIPHIAYIAITLVIRHDKHDIRPCRLNPIWT